MRNLMTIRYALAASSRAIGLVVGVVAVLLPL